MKNTTKQKAQTAIELAVFGSILIFVLGAIIRSGMNAGVQQHSTLKATRMAMKVSHEYSEGIVTGGADIASRNSVTLLFVEDRIPANSDKYGAFDRMPAMVMGSATHSRQLFMPIDFGQNEDLPVFDVFVNGKHFVFSTAAFKTIELASTDPAVCGAAPIPCPGPGLDPVADWEPKCATKTVTYACTELDCDPSCERFPPVWPDDLGGCVSAVVPKIVTTSIGCPKLYTIVENYLLETNWCDDSTFPCPQACGTSPALGCNLSADERFDLDRADLDGNGANEAVTNPLDREWFAWQWYLIAGWHKPRTIRAVVFGANAPIGPTTEFTINMAEGVIFEDSDCSEQCEKAKNTNLDFDRDLRLEALMPDTKVIDKNGVLLSVGVIDPQDGDVDSSKTDPAPGFTKDAQIFTFVRDDTSADGGTYFQIDEGKLFTVGGDVRQYIRTVSKKDQIDVIQRVFQLSNDTRRYCLGGAPTNWSAVNNVTINGVAYNDITKGERIAGLTNPVEVCNDCFSSTNIVKTCMDTTNLLIFIRSRLKDLHGRKWVTDVSGDPSVDFVR